MRWELASSALRGWWDDVNESPQWQDAAFFSLVSAVALIQLIRIQRRVPEFGWTTHKVFHLINFLVNGVRALVFGFHVHVFLLHTKVYKLVLLDLPGLLFFSTYTLLVLFWAEIYHQARSLPTDKLRPAYIAVNTIIYAVQVCIWIYLGINDNAVVELASKIFIVAVSFLALLGFSVYGGSLFVLLRRFPIESKGRQKKLYEVGTVTAICVTCFQIRCVVGLPSEIAAGDRDEMDAGGGGVLAAVLCMLLVFAIFPLLLWRRRSDAATADNHHLPPQPLQEDQVLHGRAAARRMRRRPRAAEAGSSAASTSRNEDDAESDEEEVPEGHNVPRSSKKEKKRQELEAQRQAEEAARDSRSSKQDRYDEMRRKKDEEREAQERQLEEEAKARKAKEDEAAALEFEKWKGAFSVDAEGTTESETQDDGQGLLHNFVEYIKKQKCVPLEDLAAEFRMRTQDCINRIVTLESMDRLSGVMDDRGKFIYISTEEMKAVAEYIRKQGRVSISHLANNSNQFIDLEPKAQYEEEIQQDDSAAAAGTEP